MADARAGVAWRSEGRVRVTRPSPVLRRPWGAASAEGMAPCGRGVPGGRCVPDSPAGFVYPASRCPRVLPRRASSQGPLGHPRVTRRRRAGSDSLASLAQWSHRACPSPRVSCFAKCMLSREDAYLVKDFFFLSGKARFVTVHALPAGGHCCRCLGALQGQPPTRVCPSLRIHFTRSSAPGSFHLTLRPGALSISANGFTSFFFFSPA